MPYSKGEHEKCKSGQIAVIKDGDGTLMGCHDTEAKANEHLAALHASEGEGSRVHEGTSDSAIIALPIPESVAQTLTIEHQNALKADELHITLAYLGKIGEHIQATQFRAVLESVTAVAARTEPVPVRFSGIGRFVKTNSEGQQALYLTVNSPDVRNLYETLVQALPDDVTVAPEERDFQPHVTLTYLDEDDTPGVEVSDAEFEIKEMILAWGDNVTVVPLGQPERAMPQHFHTRAMFDGTETRAEELLKNPSLPVPFIASTEGMKRDGKNLKSDEWSLKRYLDYPVVLFGHDYEGRIALPIGLGEAVRVEDKAVKLNILYDEEDDFAMRCRSKAIKGMMSASITWVREGGVNELVEVSNVPIGLDPDAGPDIQNIQRSGMRVLRDSVDAALGDEEGYKRLVADLRTDLESALEQREEEAEEEEPDETPNESEETDDGPDESSRALGLWDVDEQVWNMLQDWIGWNGRYIGVFFQEGNTFVVCAKSGRFLAMDLEIGESEVRVVGEPRLVRQVWLPVEEENEEPDDEGGMRSENGEAEPDETAVDEPELDAELLAEISKLFGTEQ